MDIIIAGAGDVGFHLAELLVKEEQNITLIDENEEILAYAADHLDVSVVLGDCSSHKVLHQAEVHKAKLFIAVTTRHSTNILACLLAKKLGAKKTIARTNNLEYLEPEQKKHFEDLGVDELFSPRHLAVLEIQRLLKRVSVTDFFDFENGKISVLGFTIDHRSNLVGKRFSDFNETSTDYHVKVVCVLREEKTYVVKGDGRILENDHIYLAVDQKGIEMSNKYIGKSFKKVRKIMITGSSDIALEAAKLLEKDKEVKVIVKDEKSCKVFHSQLQNSLVIKGDPNNTVLLREEDLDLMDTFIALTSNAETNILSCLMAEKEGVNKTIALVDNVAYTHISQNIGVDTIINKKILAANEIFRHVRKGKVKVIASFHGVDGEIIEFTIEKNNHLTRKSIDEINLPEDAVIVGVVRNQEGIIPRADFILQSGDQLIIFTLPDCVKAVERIFR